MSARAASRESMSLLDPALLTAIADLELVARVTVDGTISGLHRSPFHGYSAEFSQYRHYRSGDDLKYVDWKLFARTDRLYTKQYRETTNLVAQLALDASASMGFRGRAGVSKLEYGRLLAAALAHLTITQGDAFGLVVYDDGLRQFVPSRTGQPGAATTLRRRKKPDAVLLAERFESVGDDAFLGPVVEIAGLCAPGLARAA